MKKVMMLHSVNHNMYGKRNPEQYGTITLDEINDLIKKQQKKKESSLIISRQIMKEKW